ncbi:uncharacterized protein EV422DRAFT_581244 [Fimicolochytrium jonesii]|uniref:uncharacterized protein n=1 Tax=Fimicolochytrium jonesii TaxID=1396493 RepID=UPI0022FE9494|nr:uncharacterized protein EV422DRAFT_581244 [Fimicolochytrium jonesii]KAI8816713.1 hypothetical protein EV422DRAFT_581244 [Fimicolochytrium jonesii]
MAAAAAAEPDVLETIKLWRANLQSATVDPAEISGQVDLLIGLLSERTAELSSLQDHLACPVCTDYFVLPFTLDCGHVFCYECLDQWFAHLDVDGSEPKCPTCRERIVSRPRKDRVLARLVEECVEKKTDADSLRICLRIETSSATLEKLSHPFPNFLWPVFHRSSEGNLTQLNNGSCERCGQDYWAETSDLADFPGDSHESDSPSEWSQHDSESDATFSPPPSESEFENSFDGDSTQHDTQEAVNSFWDLSIRNHGRPSTENPFDFQGLLASVRRDVDSITHNQQRAERMIRERAGQWSSSHNRPSFGRSLSADNDDEIGGNSGSQVTLELESDGEVLDDIARPSGATTFLDDLEDLSFEDSSPTSPPASPEPEKTADDNGTRPVDYIVSQSTEPSPPLSPHPQWSREDDSESAEEDDEDSGLDDKGARKPTIWEEEDDVDGDEDGEEEKEQQHSDRGNRDINGHTSAPFYQGRTRRANSTRPFHPIGRPLTSPLSAFHTNFAAIWALHSQIDHELGLEDAEQSHLELHRSALRAHDRHISEHTDDDDSGEEEDDGEEGEQGNVTESDSEESAFSDWATESEPHAGGMDTHTAGLERQAGPLGGAGGRGGGSGGNRRGRISLPHEFSDAGDESL